MNENEYKIKIRTQSIKDHEVRHKNSPSYANSLPINYHTSS